MFAFFIPDDLQWSKLHSFLWIKKKWRKYMQMVEGRMWQHQNYILYIAMHVV